MSQAKPTKTKRLLPENHWAALDIGSNSFHFIYVRERDQHIELLHKEKYPVQLAAGLDQHRVLSQQVIDQALVVLEQLALTSQNLTADNFRVVATYTLRSAVNVEQFLTAAKKVFPFDIEVISGHEEARLIYQGVAHNHVAHGKRLVIDIGGGSTEFIIGEGYHPLTLSSLNMGCVSFQQRYFEQGKITANNFAKAKLAAQLKLEKIAARFKLLGWQHALGCSGTFKTIWQMSQQLMPEANAITQQSLALIEQHLVAAGHCDKINLIPLKPKRKQVICGGAAIASALFELFNIDQLHYCDYALRDGVIAELVDAKPYHDIRERTVESLSQRFAIDKQQQQAVWQTAQQLLNQVDSHWQLRGSIYPRLLQWACYLHEIGFDINVTGYQKHGEYILQHSDMPGFNQVQQQVLAWLVGNHRKKIQQLNALNVTNLASEKLYRILVLLRLSVLLNQQRNLAPTPDIQIHVKKNHLVLTFYDTQITRQTILYAELQQEVDYIKHVDVQLELKVFKPLE